MSWPTPHNWRQIRHERKDVRIFAILLALTLITTTVAGYWHMTMFVEMTTGSKAPNGIGMSMGAIQFSAALLAILGAHEYGHYWMGHYYCLKTALPRFLPGPTIAGTLGAYVMMERLDSRDANFDIAAAGPVAGFVVCVPTVWLGLTLSEAVPIQAAAETGLILGTPALMTLLTALTQEMIHGPLLSTQTLALHPIATAGWVGLFATSLNLLPAGNLDGGRIARAVGGKTLWTILGWATTIALAVWSYYEPVWRVWTILMTGLTIIAQMDRQPAIARTPLDRTRAWTAAALALIMMMSFTARPLS